VRLVGREAKCAAGRGRRGGTATLLRVRARPCGDTTAIAGCRTLSGARARPCRRRRLRRD